MVTVRTWLLMEVTMNVLIPTSQDIVCYWCTTRVTSDCSDPFTHSSFRKCPGVNTCRKRKAGYDGAFVIYYIYTIGPFISSESESWYCFQRPVCWHVVLGTCTYDRCTCTCDQENFLSDPKSISMFFPHFLDLLSD